MSQRLDHLTAIVAIDLNGAIGCRNSLPWRLRSDMKFFRETTMGNTVVMGRKTFDSIGGCLLKRDNIVLSHNDVLFASTPHCQLALSLPEALYLSARYRAKTAYVVGGAITYRQFAPLVDRYLVTIVNHEVHEADAFLSDDVMQSLKDWPGIEITRSDAAEGIDDFPFVIYEHIAPDADERKAQRDEIISNYAQQIGKPVSRRSASPGRGALPQEAFAF